MDVLQPRCQPPGQRAAHTRRRSGRVSWHLHCNSPEPCPRWEAFSWLAHGLLGTSREAWVVLGFWPPEPLTTCMLVMLASARCRMLQTPRGRLAQVGAQVSRRRGVRGAGGG